MDATRKGTWAAGFALIAAIGLALWAIGPDRIQAFFRALHDVKSLVAWGGYSVLAAIVFAETGLLVGFFLPGDSLLVTAGVFAKLGLLDVVALNALLVPVAIAGDAVNYLIGRRTGPLIFRREEGLLFRRAHLERAQRFYARHGGKTIILARFLPILRTFAPYAAGMAGMPYRRFAAFNVVGAFAWVLGMTMTGYVIASIMPDAEKNILWIILIVIVLSFVPGAIEVLRERRRRREARGGPAES
jgi:membrane-associated protein